MPVFTIKTSRGGRPKTFTDLGSLLSALRYHLSQDIYWRGAGKFIVEVKPEKPGERS